jgi:hypothetical protein
MRRTSGRTSGLKEDKARQYGDRHLTMEKAARLQTASPAQLPRTNRMGRRGPLPPPKGVTRLAGRAGRKAGLLARLLVPGASCC